MPASSYTARVLAQGVVPDGVTVHALAPSPLPPGAGRTLEAALADADGVPEARSEGPLLVVVNDPDRATASADVLAALRRRVGGRRIDVLVATGSHRWDDARRARHEDPLRRAAGEPVTFAWHDGADDAAHAPAGGSRLDRRLLDAAEVVAVGSVEPHWFAGFTGAHKTLTVGAMHRDDIARNHRLALDAGAAPCVLAGNPVHEALLPPLAAVVASRAVLAVQHVGDRWFAGEALATLEEAARAAASRWAKTLTRPLDFVLTRVDPPLSRTLYQAEKGVKLAEHAVRDGGAIVLDAPCEDGVGPARFVDLLRAAPDERTARAAVERDGYRLGDHKAVRLRALTARGVRLALVAPGFDPTVARVAGFELLRDLEHARRWLASHVDPDGEGAVVEDGGHVVVRVGA